eukprot:75217-Chlamydomonas_euryale.AAC.1
MGPLAQLTPDMHVMRHACPALHLAQTLLLAAHTSQAAAACGVLTSPDIQQQRFAPGLLTD